MRDVTFTHYLAQAPAVTVDEGSRAVLLLVGSTDQWPTPQDRRDEMIRRRAMRTAWRLDANQRLDFGTLAFMLRAICQPPRGLNDVVSSRTGFGDRRAALRTCEYERLLPHRLPHAPVTGGELLTAITKAEAYVRDGPEGGSVTPR